MVNKKEYDIAIDYALKDPSQFNLRANTWHKWEKDDLKIVNWPSIKQFILDKINKLYAEQSPKVTKISDSQLGNQISYDIIPAKLGVEMFEKEKKYRLFLFAAYDDDTYMKRNDIFNQSTFNAAVGEFVRLFLMDVAYNYYKNIYPPNKNYFADWLSDNKNTNLNYIDKNPFAVQILSAANTYSTAVGTYNKELLEFRELVRDEIDTHGKIRRRVKLDVQYGLEKLREIEQDVKKYEDNFARVQTLYRAMRAEMIREIYDSGKIEDAEFVAMFKDLNDDKELTEAQKTVELAYSVMEKPITPEYVENLVEKAQDDIYEETYGPIMDMRGLSPDMQREIKRLEAQYK